MTETHLIADDADIRLIVSPPENEAEVVSVSVRDEFGYECGISLDYDDLVMLILAVIAEATRNGAEGLAFEGAL